MLLTIYQVIQDHAKEVWNIIEKIILEHFWFKFKITAVLQFMNNKKITLITVLHKHGCMVISVHEKKKNYRDRQTEWKWISD